MSSESGRNLPDQHTPIKTSIEPAQEPLPPDWSNWAQRLQSIAQSGLYYNPPPFDRERYQAVMAIAAEMVAAAAEGQPDAPANLRELVLEIMQGQAGHTTPKVDVRGVVFREDRVLMVEEMLDNGRWTLPGGWADPGEGGGESAAREVWEETGFRVRPVKLLAAFDRAKHHPPFLFSAYKLFFRCELLSDVREPNAANIETGEIGWFTEAEATALELSTGRVTADQLRRFFRHLREPDLPTEFD